MEDVMEDAVEEVVERDFESEAAKDGWAPLDQWKGDPENWKSAEKFVADGENINGILKKKVDRLESRVEQIQESSRQLHEMSQRQINKEKAENKKLIKELEDVRKQAVTDGDGDAFQRAQEQISSLESQGNPNTQTLSPAAEGWLASNSWYSTNKKLSVYADGLSDSLRSQGYNDQSPAFFGELTKQVRDTFPEEFENKNRTKANGVETGGERGSRDSKDKTFANLPKEAKDAFKNFQRDIPGLTKEQYVEQYDFDDQE